jgi:molybdopterin molybdotransferase
MLGASMLHFEDARRRVLAEVTALPAESVPLEEAASRVLAEDLIAGSDLPPFDYSAMDGYALAAANLTGDGPWTLRVEGESRAGSADPPLLNGTACRIFTGAPLPEGADAVVMQENVERTGDTIRIPERPKPGQHIRRAGEDLARGAVALHAGTRLGPYQVGLLAALDRARVDVRRRPKVAILCTGSELRTPGAPNAFGRIPDSNGPSLAVMARAAGAIADVLPLTGDDFEQTRDAIRAALTDSDVLVTVGGVSVGDYDVVRRALEAAGATLDFWKVRIKPGKPLVFGRFDSTFVLGLPGNPVSAQLTFGLFGLPLLRKLQGDRHVLPRLSRARLGASLAQKPGRMGFYGAVRDGGRVLPLANQASGATTSLAFAQTLIIVPAESDGYEAGEDVDVIDLGDL